MNAGPGGQGGPQAFLQQAMDGAQEEGKWYRDGHSKGAGPEILTPL